MRISCTASMTLAMLAIVRISPCSLTRLEMRERIASSPEKAAEDVCKDRLLREQIDDYIFSIQQTLFDPEHPTTEDYLLKSMSYFQPVHYEQVVLERHSLGICAYPTCSNQARTHLAASRFRLSPSTRRIIDTAVAKYFCSDTCQAKSSRLGDQISDVSVYQRFAAGIPSKDSQSDCLADQMAKIKIIERRN